MAEGLPAHGEAAPGDHLQTGYNLWLVGHQLEHGRAPWRDPYSFQPQVEPRWNLAGWPFGYVYWPLERLLGTVLAWNAFVLVGFLGAGGLAALWLRELGLRRGAALAGGLAFALAPYLQAQWSAGHLLAWSALLLPLSLFAVERARRGSRWWLVLAGAALCSIPLSGQLHLSLAVIPFFCGLRARPAPVGGRCSVLPAMLAGLVAYVLAVRDTTGASGRQFSQVEHYSADASRFLSRNTDELEKVVYLGWTIVVLAARRAGLVLPRAPVRARRRPRARSARSRSCSLSARTCPGTTPLWRAPARPAPHARSRAADAGRLPGAGGAARDRRVAHALARNGGHRRRAAPRRAPARHVPRDRGRREQRRLRCPARRAGGPVLELPVFRSGSQDASTSTSTT